GIRDGHVTGVQTCALPILNNGEMEIDLLLDPFGASWPDMLEAARTAEQAGFGGIWTWDHLAGSVHGQPHVLECWTVLSALAAARSEERRVGKECRRLRSEE